MSALLSIWTVVVGAIFIAIVIWALGRKRSAEFEAAARIPLDDDHDLEPTPKQTDGGQ